MTLMTYPFDLPTVLRWIMHGKATGNYKYYWKYLITETFWQILCCHLSMTSAQKHRSHDDFGITLNIGNKIIKPQDNERLYGGFILNDLTWKENIRNNKKSFFWILTSRINALSKICKISSFKKRKMIANGSFCSNLISLISVWSGSPNYLIDLFQKLQRPSKARLVIKKNIDTPIKTLLAQFGWLSVKQLILSMFWPH